MRPPAVVLAGLVASGLVLLVTWWFDISLAQAALLAPVIVVAFGAAAGVVVLWTRVIVDSVRRRRGA